MALSDYSPVLAWFADSLSDLDIPSGSTKSTPPGTTDPSLAGSPDSYADFATSNGVTFTTPAPVGENGTGDKTIILKIQMDTSAAGRFIAENYDGSGTGDTACGWQLMNVTGTSYRIGLVAPPTLYTLEHTATPSNYGSLGTPRIIAFRRSGGTWTVWGNADATGGLESLTPGINTIGNPVFSEMGDVTFGTNRAGATPFDGRIYWLLEFDEAISDTDLALAEWADEEELKSVWIAADSSDVTGTSSLTFSPTASLTAYAARSGTSTLTFSPTASLTAYAARSGTSTLTFATAARLAGLLAGAGNAALTFAVSAAIRAYLNAEGASTLTFTPLAFLSARAYMEGEATISFTTEGELALDNDLSGDTTLTFTTIATLRAYAALSGSSSLTFTSSAASGSVADLSGSTSFAFTTQGAAAALLNASGETSLTFDTDGVLQATVALSGSTNLSLSLTGSLSAFASLSGSATLSFLTAANPVVPFPNDITIFGVPFQQTEFAVQPSHSFF